MSIQFNTPKSAHGAAEIGVDAGASATGAATSATAQNSPLAAKAETLAQQLKAALAPARMTDEARNLALAKTVGARDYDTTRAGALVRNVMSMDQAAGSDVLRMAGGAAADPARSAFSESGLAALMTGRDYIAITHGEGPNARVTVILNDSVNKNVPTALVVWREGQGLDVLMEGDLHALAQSPADRMVLGPLAHHATYATTEAGALHHEVQTGYNCALHAINAMAGGQIVSKADFDQHLIQQRIANSGHEGVAEDDFYRNTPQVSDLTHFYDFDSGIQADVLEHTLASFLHGRIARFTADAETAPQPGVRNARLLDFAELAQQYAQGCLVVRDDHVVALRKLSDPETGQPAWLLIDSARDTTRQITPAEYLHEIMDQGHCEVLSWSPAHPNPSDSRLH